MSSRGHRRSGVDFDDPRFERGAYDKWLAYGQSKTANALFAVALDTRGSLVAGDIQLAARRRPAASPNKA